MHGHGRWQVLDRYIGREIGGAFAAGLGLFVVVVTFVQLLKLLDHGQAMGLGGAELAWATLYALPPTLGLLLPISWLYACLLGIGRLSQDREVLALMQAGVGPGVLFRVPLRYGLCLAAVSAALLGWGEPWGVRGLSALLAGSAQRALSTGLQPQTFHGVGGAVTVHAASSVDGELHDLMLADRRRVARPVTLFAARARVSCGPGAGEVTFALRNGTLVVGEANGEGAEPSGGSGPAAGADARPEAYAAAAAVTDAPCGPDAAANACVTVKGDAAATAGVVGQAAATTQANAGADARTRAAAEAAPDPAAAFDAERRSYAAAGGHDAATRGPTFVDFAEGRYRLRADELVRAGRRSFTDDQGLSMQALWARGYNGHGHELAGALARITLQRKLALPLAAPIFGALAVPLGLGARGAARARSLLCSCAIVGAYYYVGRSLELAARRGALSAALAAWLPDALGLMALVGLWWWRRRRAA